MFSKLIVKRREPESKQSRVSLGTKLKTSLQCKPCKGKKNIQCILCQVSVNSLVGETEKKNTQNIFRQKQGTKPSPSQTFSVDSRYALKVARPSKKRLQRRQ